MSRLLGWVTIGVFVSFFLLSEEWGMDFWIVTWIQHIGAVSLGGQVESRVRRSGRTHEETST